MSRHTIPRNRKLGKLIVGYDRPLREFFCQVWSRAGRMSQSWTTKSIDELFIGIGVCNADAPKGLYQRLEDETLGKAPTNVLVDWSTNPPTEHTV